MPFKSKAQARLFGHKMQTGEISKATFDEWAHSTPGGIESLPEKKTTVKKLKDTQPQGTRSKSGKAAGVVKVGRVKKLGSSRSRGRGSG